MKWHLCVLVLFLIRKLICSCSVNHFEMQKCCTFSSIINASLMLLRKECYNMHVVLVVFLGWAATVTFNPKAREEFERFRHRDDTLSLGVCNGCQLLALLGWVGGAQDGGEWRNFWKVLVLHLLGRLEVFLLNVCCFVSSLWQFCIITHAWRSFVSLLPACLFSMFFSSSLPHHRLWGGIDP